MRTDRQRRQYERHRARDGADGGSREDSRSSPARARFAIVTPVADRKWVFKSTVDDEDVLERIADYLDKKKIKKVALLADTQRLRSGRDHPDEEGRPAPQTRCHVRKFRAGRHRHAFRSSRASATAAREAVICWTVTPAGVVFIKQAQQLGLDKRTLIHSYGFVSAPLHDSRRRRGEVDPARQPQAAGRRPVAGPRSAEGRHPQAVQGLSGALQAAGQPIRGGILRCRHAGERRR